jgi:uncharacterized protein YggT (Ycf19 family)
MRQPAADPLPPDGRDEMPPVRPVRPVAPYSPPGYSFRGMQIVWFVTGVVEALIVLRFAFKLLGASTASGFVAMIYSITGPLVAPFRNIFPVTAVETSVLEPASIVAFLIYLMIGAGIAQLIRIMTTPRGTRAID